jgi:type IV pilus secretin PilQ/predicted competence protein
MAGMKTRLTTFRDASNKLKKCISCGILVILLAFAPAGAKANETPSGPRLPEAQPAASAPKTDGSSTISKEVPVPVAGEPGILTDVKLAPEEGKITVTVVTDRLIKPIEFNLSDPPRLVLDFPNARNRTKLMELPVHAGSVKQLRIQQFQTTPSKIARMVFDLEDSSEKHEISVDKNSVRITFNTKSQPGSPSSGQQPKPALPQAENPSKKLTAPPAPAPPRSESSQPVDSGTAQKARSAEPQSKASSSAPRSLSTRAAQPKEPKPEMPDLKTRPATDPSRSALHESVAGTPKKEIAAQIKGSPETLPQAENPLKKPTAPPAAPARFDFSKTVDSGTAQKARSADSPSQALSSADRSSLAQPARLKAPKSEMPDLNTKPAADPSRSEAHQKVSGTLKKETAAKSKGSGEALPQAENTPRNSPVPPVALARSQSSEAVDSETAQKMHSEEPVFKTPSPAPKLVSAESAQPKAPKTGMPELKTRLATEPSRNEANENVSGTRDKETVAKSTVLPESLPTTQLPDLSKTPELSKAPETRIDERPRVIQIHSNDPNVTPLSAALASSPSASPKMTSPANTRFFGQPLTLDLIDIPLVDFFRLMAEEGGINIVMDPEIKGRISIKVVKVPWDQIFEAALANNELDKQVEGTLVRIARKSTLQDEAKQRESLKKANLLAADLETRIKRLNYVKAGTLVNALVDQKTVRGTVVVDERSNSLILTDLPGSLDKLTQLIDTLDAPQPQVEIEARIVSATRDFARDIGMQFGFVDGNLQRVSVGGPNTFGTIGGTRPSATPTNTFSAGTSTGRGASQSSSTDSAGVSTGTSTNNKGNWNVNLPATKAFGGLGISIGNIFDTFLLDAAITAGESKGLAKLISQPKVTAQNNSPAVITQGLRFPVQIIANNTVTVQFQNAALTLTVTPQITYEGNIVLDLKVENNTPDFSRQVNGIPSIRTSESTTRVLVSDGGTTVIGGILVDDESTTEDKVPGLGSLPLVGNLFRHTSVSRSTQEVLFFVTPRIIK